jgi:Skp family chaperone for outer membrane proteins
MRVLFGAAVLSVMLAAAPTFAQGQGQAPAQPAPQTPAPAAPAPAAPRPFPEGTKYAIINIQRIANDSAQGRASTAKVQALNQQKVQELNEKNKQLQAAQQKLEAGASVLSATAAAQLQKEIERQQIDIQRYTEDAQQELQQLQQQLQGEFEVKLTPIIQQVASERGLHLIFSAADAGLVWGDPALDLTTEVIARFDKANPAPAAAAPAATQKPAPPPATQKPAPAPAPGTQKP